MRIGFVGTGQLLEAMLAGALHAGLPRDWLVCSARRPERAMELGGRYGVTVEARAADAARDAHLVLVGVTPAALPDVCREVGEALRPGAVVAVATAPASLAEIEAALPDGTAVVRVMPSVNARVGHGICGLARGTHVSDDQLDLVRTFLEGQGEVVETDEAGLGPVGGLAGSGPAYVAAMVRAMADGGVAMGLPEDEALRLAVETVTGTAAMLATGLSPEEVERAVGHPGGSTVRSLDHLAGSGALAAMTAAVTHSFEEQA